MDTQKIENLRTQNSSYYELDDYFVSTVQAFMSTLPKSYDRVNILFVMKNFYSVLLEDKSIFSKRDGRLLIDKITIHHIQEFQGRIEQEVILNIKSKTYGKNILHYVSLFCKYLSEVNLVHLFYRPINFLKKDSVKKKELPLLLSNFKQYLQNRNYSNQKQYIKIIKAYLNFSGFHDGFNISECFAEQRIKEYEEKLRRQIVKEQLSAASAYQYLKGVRLFFNYLYEEKKINFKYTIPESLINQSKRSNEYVSSKEILKILDSIVNYSNNCLRDLCIILLLMETGCRPIELANVNVIDITLSERLIVLRSKKSGQRKLKLSHELIDFIRDYLLIRRNYLFSDIENSLLLNQNGSRITTTTIYDVVRKNNIRAFGYMRFSPKSLRHTFITNAFNNKSNNIENIAETVGHKHLSSTLYYFYRDINTIRNIALDKELHLKGGKIYGN